MACVRPSKLGITSRPGRPEIPKSRQETEAKSSLITRHREAQMRAEHICFKGSRHGLRARKENVGTGNRHGGCTFCMERSGNLDPTHARGEHMRRPPARRPPARRARAHGSSPQASSASNRGWRPWGGSKAPSVLRCLRATLRSLPQKAPARMRHRHGGRTADTKSPLNSSLAKTIRAEVQKHCTRPTREPSYATPCSTSDQNIPEVAMPAALARRMMAECLQRRGRPKVAQTLLELL